MERAVPAPRTRCVLYRECFYIRIRPAAGPSGPRGLGAMVFFQLLCENLAPPLPRRVIALCLLRRTPFRACRDIRFSRCPRDASLRRRKKELYRIAGNLSTESSMSTVLHNSDIPPDGVPSCAGAARRHSASLGGRNTIAFGSRIGREIFRLPKISCIGRGNALYSTPYLRVPY